MITDAFISIFITIINWAHGMLPAWAFYNTSQDSVNFYGVGTNTWTSGTWLTQFCKWISTFNNILPVTEMIFILSLVLAYFAVLVSIRTSKWFIGVVRGSGTS